MMKYFKHVQYYASHAWNRAMFSPAAMLDAARQINYFFIVK